MSTDVVFVGLDCVFQNNKFWVSTVVLMSCLYFDFLNKGVLGQMMLGVWVSTVAFMSCLYVE